MSSALQLVGTYGTVRARLAEALAEQLLKAHYGTSAVRDGISDTANSRALRSRIGSVSNLARSRPLRTLGPAALTTLSMGYRP